MRSLDDAFDELAVRLDAWRGGSERRGDPIFYFVFPPEQAFEVKRRIPQWSSKLLQQQGRDVRVESFSNLLWDLVDESGRWESWLEVEADAELDQINEAVRDVLISNNALINRLDELIESAGTNIILFLTDTEMLHPYFRVRTLESALHDRIRIPVVVFYPGRRAGQHGLHFLGFYPEDGNYRATIIGGLP